MSYIHSIRADVSDAPRCLTTYLLQHFPMPESTPSIKLVLGGRYEFLCEVKGSIGGGHICIGDKGACRFCGTRESSRFRKLAHTMPEALGNKWIFSRDECDDCNTQKFSLPSR